MADWTVKLVHMDGTVVRTLVDTNVVSVTRKLNKAPAAVFTFPKHDPPSAIGQGADVQTLGNEVQVWRTGDAEPYFWGTPGQIQASSGRGEVTVTCVGLADHFGRRMVDKPLTNILANPDFEGGLTSWTAVGVTANSVTTPIRRGTHSAQLIQASAGTDTYLEQVVTFTGDASIGTFLTLVAWIWIDPAAWVGPASGSRGLYVQGVRSGTPLPPAFTVIDDSTPRGDWQRFTTNISVAPGETWDLHVRLYAPGGTVYWDACEFVAMESLGANGATISALACKVIDFITQNALSGKSDLHIATDASAGGPTVASKWYEFADHIVAARALQEYTDRDDGIDWSVETGGGGTTRTFKTWYPRKGTDRTATVTLTVGGATPNCASYSYGEDGTAVENDVTILGEGSSGPDRETGYDRDLSLVTTVYQGVYPCTPGATVDQLDLQAVAKVNKTKAVVKLPTVLAIPVAGGVDLIGTVVEGDTVTLSINDGWVQSAAPYRVVGFTTNCKDNTMAMTLNAA